MMVRMYKKKESSILPRSLMNEQLEGRYNRERTRKRWSDDRGDNLNEIGENMNRKEQMRRTELSVEENSI